MGDVFGKPAIVTDTHCIRLTNRIGLVDGIKDPKKVEMALWRAAISAIVLFTTEERSVLHGQSHIVINVVWRISARKISDINRSAEVLRECFRLLGI